MRKFWKKKSREDIKAIVFAALKKNVNFYEENILGVPVSYLDEKVFSLDHHFLSDAPYLTSLIHNPNHIGCHTLGTSEPFFQGTQKLEQEMIKICAVDILGGKDGGQDGYLASGGTEANIQAIWTFRNYFMQEESANLSDMVILCSKDSHYSMDKAANLLSLDIIKIDVYEDSRLLDSKDLDEKLDEAKKAGKKYFIVVANMMTTMFGSIDDPDVYCEALKERELNYMMHVDGAFGGFYYPFTDVDNKLSFKNPCISSIALDAHKMAQAPYGTGIFIINKGLMKYSNTQADYVEGHDFTLIGSRSGANAVAVWMILMTNGPYGWDEKIFILQKRSEWVCKQLKSMKIDFYRHKHSNIFTIKSKFISDDIAEKHGLVPDNHAAPKWYKIVIMEHVTIEKLEPLMLDLENYNS